MGMIYIKERCKKPKKKPGWKEAAQQEKEWLSSINNMKLFVQPGCKYQGKLTNTGKRVTPVVDGTLPLPDRMEKTGKSLKTIGGIAGKPVIRPEILYKDNPELLERELKARQKKFNVAPAYNKGGDQLITEEELVKVLSGNKRRS